MAPTWIMQLWRDGHVLDQRYPAGERAELRSRMAEWLVLHPDATHATLHPLGEALEIGGEVERVERVLASFASKLTSPLAWK
jgi:hypothetical protein